MVNVADVVVVLPHSSVVVNVNRAVPVAPHTSLSVVKSLVMVKVQLLSVAATSDSQSFNSSSFPSPSHSTV